MSRSQFHLNALRREVEAMFPDDACETVPGLNSKGKPVLRVKNVPAGDPRLGVIIGDVAHNLRSALDHLIYAISIPKGATEPVDPQAPAFPITSSPKYWRKSRWRLEQAPRGTLTRVERFQPYHRRKYPETWLLWQLRELSDIDKHRLIHAAPAAIEAHQVRWTSIGPGHVVFRGYRVRRSPLKEGAIAMWWDFDGGPKAEMEVNAELALGIAFDKTTPSKALRYERVLPLLWAIGTFIHTIVIPEFAALIGEPWSVVPPTTKQGLTTPEGEIRERPASTEKGQA